MTVETDTRTMKVGDRVDLTASRLTHNPGTVMQVEAATVRVLWDGNIGSGSVDDADRGATRYRSDRELRMLTDEEMAEHPVPVKVSEYLSHTDAYDKPSHQVPPGSIVVTQAEWDQRGTDVTLLRQQNIAVQREFERFKERVVEDAVEATEAHGWCSEVREVIEGLGLEWPEQSKQIEFDVEITVHVTATVSGDNASKADDENFVRSCLSVDEDGQISHDSDLDDVSFSSSGHRVENLQEVD